MAPRSADTLPGRAFAALKAMVNAYREGCADDDEPSMVRDALAVIAEIEAIGPGVIEAPEKTSRALAEAVRTSTDALNTAIYEAVGADLIVSVRHIDVQTLGRRPLPRVVCAVTQEV